MNRKNPIIIGAIVTVIVVGIVLSYFGNELDDVFIRKSHDSVSSGPLTVTQYEHKLGEDVFFLVRDLKLTDKGTIRVFTPEGIEYKTIFYDGSYKQNFNQFFFPDTFAKIDICTPDQLVGIWRAQGPRTAIYSISRLISLRSRLWHRQAGRTRSGFCFRFARFSGFGSW